jgi:SsrA-binding protein
MAVKIICQNKKAYHNYDISDRFEAGIQLRGSEIKQIRKGKISIDVAFVNIENEEIFLINSSISKSQDSKVFSHDEYRRRKLLLHKNEILKIKMRKEKKGFTIVPLKVYLKNGLCKVEIAIAKGKKTHDKREALKAKDQKDHLNRIMSRSKLV